VRVVEAIFANIYVTSGAILICSSVPILFRTRSASCLSLAMELQNMFQWKCIDFMELISNRNSKFNWLYVICTIFFLYAIPVGGIASSFIKCIKIKRLALFMNPKIKINNIFIFQFILRNVGKHSIKQSFT